MNIKKLKMELGVLTLGHLEEAGFVNTEDESTAEGVIIRVTPDSHNKLFNEVMWASSVNNEQGRFALLMHAMLYDKQTAKEMGKPAEVAQVVLNKEKAAMIVDTIRHAFPELLEEMEDVPIGGTSLEEKEGIDLFTDEDEDTDDEDCGDHCISCGEPFEPESDFSDLKQPSPEDIPSILTSDQLIDSHLIIKNELQRVTNSESEVKSIKIGEPYRFMYLAVPRPSELAISFDELDIIHQVKEAVNEPQILKEESARALLESIYEAFPQWKPSN